MSEEFMHWFYVIFFLVVYIAGCGFTLEMMNKDSGWDGNPFPAIGGPLIPFIAVLGAAIFLVIYPGIWLARKFK